MSADEQHAASLDAFEAQDAGGAALDLPPLVVERCFDCGAELTLDEDGSCCAECGTPCGCCP